MATSVSDRRRARWAIRPDHLVHLDGTAAIIYEITRSNDPGLDETWSQELQKRVEKPLVGLERVTALDWGLGCSGLDL